MKIPITVALIVVLAFPQPVLYAAQQPLPELQKDSTPPPAPISLAPQTTETSKSETLLLERGTRVCLRPERTLSSRTARRGDQVTFRVHDDVAVGGMIVAPDGAEVSARVAKARKSGRFFHFPKVSIEFDQLRLVNGQTVPLEKYQPHAGASGGSENPAGDIALLVMLAPLLIPLAPFTKMDDEILDKDKCIDKQIARDIVLDKAEISRLQPQPTFEPAPLSEFYPVWLDPVRIVHP